MEGETRNMQIKVSINKNSKIRKEQRKIEKSEGNRLCEKRCQTNPN